MLTKKGKYGLKALVDLARLPPGQTAFVTEIATRGRRQGIDAPDVAAYVNGRRFPKLKR